MSLDAGGTLPLQLIGSRFGGRQSRGGPCSDSNARVLAGQSLRIAIGSELSDLGYSFGGAELNIQTFQGAGLAYVLDGGAVVSTNQLVQGRLLIDDVEPFDVVELRLVGNSGSFGLRSSGGQAGGRSELTLVQTGVPIDCGESRTFDELEVDTIDEVTFARFQDKGDGDECSPARLRVEIETSAETVDGEVRDVVIIDPVGDDDRIQARVLVQWRVPRLDATGAPRPPAEINAALVRYVQYPGDEHPRFVEYCAGADGLPADLLDAETGDVGSVAEIDQPWCLLFEDRTLDGDEIVQRLIFSVNGDPRFF